MAVHERQNSAVHRTRVKQRGRESREARSGYRITCPRGIRGWPVYEDRDRTRAIERWGIPQDVDAKRTSISHIQLSPSLAHYFLFETFSTLKLKPLSHAFLSFFSRCTISFVRRAPFLKQISTWLNITKFFLQFYIEIWQILFFFFFYSQCGKLCWQRLHFVTIFDPRSRFSTAM
jgi:hypothetical protein